MLSDASRHDALQRFFPIPPETLSLSLAMELVSSSGRASGLNAEPLPEPRDERRRSGESRQVG